MVYHRNKVMHFLGKSFGKFKAHLVMHLSTPCDCFSEHFSFVFLTLACFATFSMTILVSFLGVSFSSFFISTY